jgi:hypothetical protein
MKKKNNMKRQILIAILVSCAFISCEKESDDLTKQNGIEISNLIDTTIVLTDTLNYSFGYFGDEEGISIISQAQNSKTCELLNKQWEERILQYIPQSDFLGIDSVIVVTQRGSDGASPSTDIDTIMIIVKVVKNDFHKKLIGKWNWISSCGGFTGGCSYPSEDNYEQIEFTYNMNYIEKHSDSIVRDYQYHFIGSLESGQDTIYEIGFENGYDTYYYFAGDTLNIQGGDFWKEYERIE